MSDQEAAMELAKEMMGSYWNVPASEHHPEPWILLLPLVQDAARWRKARTIFSIENIEHLAEEMRGSHISEDECLKADAAIDQERTK